jgi:hypothetical protein
MPTAFATVVRFCSTCRLDAAFEQPPCADGHDADCPEWVCVGCGDAVVVAFALDDAPAPRIARSVA